MSYKENRRLGRSMKLIRLQKTARGNIISVQAQYVFAIATVVMSESQVYLPLGKRYGYLSVGKVV